MFTKAQLELLEDILDSFGADTNHPLDLSRIAAFDPKELRELKGVVASALWAIPRTIPRKDKEAIKKAEAAGLVQICGRNTSGIEVPVAPSRMKSQAVKAKDGEELLSILGL